MWWTRKIRLALKNICGYNNVKLNIVRNCRKHEPSRQSFTKDGLYVAYLSMPIYCLSYPILYICMCLLNDGQIRAFSASLSMAAMCVPPIQPLSLQPGSNATSFKDISFFSKFHQFNGQIIVFFNYILAHCSSSNCQSNICVKLPALRPKAEKVETESISSRAQCLCVIELARPACYIDFLT